MPSKRAAETAEAADPDFQAHLSNLRIRSAEEYRRWCLVHGFKPSLDKSRWERARERERCQEAAIDEQVARSRRERRNIDDVLAAICDGRLYEDEVTQRHLKRLCQALGGRTGPQHERHFDRRVLLRLLLHCRRQGARFFNDTPVIRNLGVAAGNTYVEALPLIAAARQAWIRPLNEWRPRSHSPQRQFASLVRHLFVKYEMPGFFDSAWFVRTPAGSERRSWYLTVARGESLRTCATPIPLTKRMAHHVMQAPDDLTVDQALRWGQIFGLGGDEAVARAVLETRLGESFEHDDFWITVIRWLIEHPEFDRNQIGPMIDYVENQRFVRNSSWRAARREGAAPPVAPQPNLTMKGRTPESLQARVDEWHRQLGRSRASSGRAWEPCGIDPFEFVEGIAGHSNVKRWTIRELTTGWDLTTEGRRMNHCVASYVTSCERGYCSIWTLDLESREGHQHALTVESATQPASSARPAAATTAQRPKRNARSFSAGPQKPA